MAIHQVTEPPLESPGCSALCKTLLKEKSDTTPPPLPSSYPRRVTFDESYNIEYEAPASHTEHGQRRRCWYSRSEYKRMKESSQAIAKQIKIKESRNTASNSYQNVILRVYDKCSQSRCHYTSLVSRLPPSDTFLSQEDELLLATAVYKANSRTGLEKLIIGDIAFDKRHRRNDVAARVRFAQASCVSSSASCSASKEELVRSASESLSLTSRLFAHHMAVALEKSLEM